MAVSLKDAMAALPLVAILRGITPAEAEPAAPFDVSSPLAAHAAPASANTPAYAAAQATPRVARLREANPSS